jgi:dimethylargininase
LKIAVTRPVSPVLNQCELSFLPRNPIDIGLAATQHHAYEQALAACGCVVRALPMEPELPDSVFVEDTAILLDEVAVITRPGAVSRRAEVDSVATLLGQYRELVKIMPPATLDGGDVLRLRRTLYVGISARSSRTGIEQLARQLKRFDYQVRAVPLHGCLHLKTAVTQITYDLLLLNSDWIDAEQFPGMHVLQVAPSEPHAANALMIDNKIIYPASCPLTRAKLLQHDIEVISVDMSETEKAEGGVTCCSLIFDA